jgi:ClpP class serine protease
VARGRNRPTTDVEPLAQGRVWTGAEALRNGLVDHLGGLDVALDALRGRIGRGASKLPVVVLRAPRRASSALDATLRETAQVASLVEALAHAFAFCPDVLALGRERVLAWSPAAASVSQRS